MKKILSIFLTVLLSSVMLNAKDITLTKDNTIILSDSFSGNSVSKLMKEAKAIDANLPSGYPMYLFLYTPGGSIQAGIELIEYFKGLNRPVHTITLFSASMGFQTVQHLGNRYIVNYGILMSHKARGGFEGDFGDGASQLDARYGLWLRRVAMMDQETVKRTKGKQTLLTYRAAYQNELWLNGQEAVDQGYADEVATVKCDTTLAAPREESFDYGYFKVNLVFSGCPLNTSPLSVSISLFTTKGEMGLNDFLQKGGVFGPTCRGTDIKTKPKYYDDPELELPAQLCASDKTLTLDLLKKASNDKESYFNKDLKSNVQYSY